MYTWISVFVQHGVKSFIFSCSTSLQQTVGVPILHQITVYRDVVQRLQGRTLLHVLVGHREAGLGAVPHQTATATHRTQSHDRVETDGSFQSQHATDLGLI